MDESRGLKSSATSAMLWVGGASILRDIVQFGSMLILVRLLSPLVYGQAALAQTIFGFLAIASFRSIVGYALQARSPASFNWTAQLSVGFVINGLIFLLCNLLSLCLYLAGGDAVGEVPAILAVMSIGLLFEPLASQHHTWLHAHHRWARLRVLELATCLAGAAAGIALAAAGAGVFALAAMTPLQQIPALLDALRFREHRHRFSFRSIKDYHAGRSYGTNRVVSGMAGAGAGVVEQSLLTSLFGFSSLGLFSRAVGLANMTSGRFGPIAVHTLFPVLTRAEAGSARFRRFSRLLFAAVLAVSIPAGSFLAFEATRVVALLYGAKWVDVSPLLAMAAFVVLVGGGNTLLNQIMLANNQQRQCLYLDFFGAITRLGTAAATLQFGVQTFLAALGLQGLLVFGYGLRLAHIGKALDGWAVLWPVLPVSTAALVSGALVSAIPFGVDSDYLLLTLLWHALAFGLFYIIAVRLLAGRLLAELLSSVSVPQKLMSRINYILFLENWRGDDGQGDVTYR